MELFRTVRKGLAVGNYKYYDTITGKNIDLGTEDLELARAKYPTATIAAEKGRPTFASVLATPTAAPTPTTVASPTTATAPAKPVSGDIRPRGVDYTPAQIQRLRETYVQMIAEADCDMMRLAFSLFGYHTPDIRPEDIAQLKLGWEMLAMEWFVNGVPPAWLVLSLTHIKLITRLSINAKLKIPKQQEEKSQ